MALFYVSLASPFSENPAGKKRKTKRKKKTLVRPQPALSLFLSFLLLAQLLPKTATAQKTDRCRHLPSAPARRCRPPPRAPCHATHLLPPPIKQAPSALLPLRKPSSFPSRRRRLFSPLPSLLLLPSHHQISTEPEEINTTAAMGSALS